MGTIKFEIDLPEFNNELSINLIIRKDGEVLYSTSSPSADYSTTKSSGRIDTGVGSSKSTVESIVEKSSAGNNEGMVKKVIEQPIQKTETVTLKKKVLSGNMMDGLF